MTLPRNRLRMVATGLALTAIAGVQTLSSQPPAEHEHSVHRSPYAEQADTGIASLSPRELEQLQNGDGMGLARAAELNGYPGPKHALELSAEIALSHEQKDALRGIFDTMQREARDLGARIIEAERGLDLRFRHRHLEEARLGELTSAIAELHGSLRFAHLRAHLATAALLSPEQIDEYNRLRGYEP